MKRKPRLKLVYNDFDFSVGRQSDRNRKGHCIRDAQLRPCLPARGASLDLFDEEVRQFSDRVLAYSCQALRHAFVLKNLSEGFQTQQLRTISPNAKALTMFREHARNFEEQTRQLGFELKPILASLSAPASNSKLVLKIETEVDLAHAIYQLYQLTKYYDKAIEAAFTSTKPSDHLLVNSRQIWLSLKNAEQIAILIQSAFDRLTLTNEQGATVVRPITPFTVLSEPVDFSDRETIEQCQDDECKRQGRLKRHTFLRTDRSTLREMAAQAAFHKWKSSGERS